MTVVKVIALVAVIALFCLVYFRFVRWAIREWKRIEAEEERLRQTRCPELRTRGGN